MDRAIGYLRRDRNAVAALAALDSYLGRYPHGALEKEARLARVDALMLLWLKVWKTRSAAASACRPQRHMS